MNTRIPMGRQACGSKAFTLIEVLVVVAILALLISILVPSLVAARNVTKLTIDKANSKQIATMVSTYQAEYQGYVPLLFNYWSNATRPAENCWLSVALRRYDSQNRGRLSKKSDPGDSLAAFDATTQWSNEVRTEYEVKYMPEYFRCPFQRGKAPQVPNPNVTTTSNVVHLEYGGRWESYNTWLHTASDGFGIIAKGTRLNSNRDPDAWLSKYTTITFNYQAKHRKWDVRRRDGGVGGSPSDWTAIYCGQGEFTPFPESSNSPTRRANIGSHANNAIGGTNVIFADTHVEWVPGKNLGRP